MKKVIVYIILVLTFISVSIAAPIRKVVLTLKPNESIYWGEYVSNYHISGYNYICILKDKVAKKETLVWNGQRKVCADWVCLGHIDVNDFRKCVYTYKTGDDQYIQLEDKKYGPYQWVGYADWYPMKWSNGEVNIRYYNRYCFDFDLMGNEYTHDHDGTIYKKNEGRFDYSSFDKKHYAKIAEDRRMITIDGKNFVIPIPVDMKKIAQPELCLFNDGTCYYEQTGMDEDNNWKKYIFYITPSEVRAISQKTEYFDFDSHAIKAQSIKPSSEGVHNFPEIPTKRKENTQEWILAYEFSLQDNSKRHSLIAKWDYNYILLDGKKIGTQCPIEAFYDSTSNSFGWVTIENRQIVLYTYALGL